MKNVPGIIVAAAVISALAWPLAGLPPAAAEDAEISMDLFMRYVSLKGDEEKFQAHHWMDTGAAAGIENMSYKKVFEDDSLLEFEGRYIFSENDTEGLLLWKKDNVGVMKMYYQRYPKYYGDGGGYYHPFSGAFQYTELGRELRMDMSEFLLSFDVISDNWPDLTVEYEHGDKDGEKSRLTWTGVNDSGTTRKIGPSYQVLDQETDALNIKGETEFAGMIVKGKQRFEVTDIFSLREEKNLSDTAGSGRKIQKQWQSINSQAATSTLLGERWFNENKSFTSLAYRFHQIELTETQTLSEFDENLNPSCFSHCKNSPGGHADAELDSHIWTNMFFTNFTEDLSLTTKLKAEKTQRQGDALYPVDNENPPDGLANTYESSDTKDKMWKFGENISLRYQGFETVSFYAEGDFAQGRTWLFEELKNLNGQDTASTSGNFLRETVTYNRKNIFTLGSRWVPVRWFDMNAQVRHGREVNDYDDVVETSSGSSARSAFIDELQIETTELSSKMTWKPAKWLRNGLRYQLLDQNFRPRVEAEEETKSHSLSHVFTYDITLHPIERLLLTTAMSYQDYKVTTPAASASSARTPGFNADVKSALVSASYRIDDTKSLFSSAYYARTDNFDDFTSIGLPLGSDYTMYDVTLGLSWQPRENLTVKPQYSYYNYDPSSVSAEYDGYSAHVGWLDVVFHW